MERYIPALVLPDTKICSVGVEEACGVLKKH